MQQQQEQEKEVDVYYILKPIFFFSRFCGLWIHSLKRSSPAISSTSLLYYCFLFSIYIYCFYINLDKEFWLTKFGVIAGSDIQTYGIWMQVLSGLLIGMISLLVGLGTYQKQWTFLETIDRIDKILNKDFSVITPKKISQTIMWVIVVCVNIMLFLLIAITYYYYELLGIPSLMICASYYISFLPYSSVVFGFCFSSLSIQKRFYYINNIFRQLASSDIPKVFDLCSRNEKNERLTPTISLQEIYSIYGGYYARKNLPLHKGQSVKEEFNREIKKLTQQLEKREDGLMVQLKRRDLIEVEEFKISKLSSVEATLDYLTKLVDIHDDLLDCIALQNQVLSFQILLIIGQIFAFGVISLFSLYRSLYNESEFFMVNIFWIGLDSFILILIMHYASQCIYEGKFTGTAVHKVINKLSNYHNVDDRIIEKLSIISHQLTMRVPDITCGLFSFDWELMFSIISATTIYLIFLMQFEEANINSTTNNNMNMSMINTTIE